MKIYVHWNLHEIMDVGGSNKLINWGDMTWTSPWFLTIMGSSQANLIMSPDHFMAITRYHFGYCVFHDIYEILFWPILKKIGWNRKGPFHLCWDNIPTLGTLRNAFFYKTMQKYNQKSSQCQCGWLWLLTVWLNTLIWSELDIEPILLSWD